MVTDPLERMVALEVSAQKTPNLDDPDSFDPTARVLGYLIIDIDDHPPSDLEDTP